MPLTFGLNITFKLRTVGRAETNQSSDAHLDLLTSVYPHSFENHTNTHTNILFTATLNFQSHPLRLLEVIGCPTFAQLS